MLTEWNLTLSITGRPGGPNAYDGTDPMNYAYNNGMTEQPQQQGQGGPTTFNGGGVPGQMNPMRNLPMNKTTRGLPAILPDPGVMGMGQSGNAMMMMNNPNNPNNPYGQTMNAVAPQPAQTTAPTSHFSFFGHHMGNNQQPQQQQQQQQSTGPSLIQKMMGGGGGGGSAMPGAPSATTENPVEGLLSKGKDLIFKKFGL